MLVTRGWQFAKFAESRLVQLYRREEFDITSHELPRGIPIESLYRAESLLYSATIAADPLHDPHKHLAVSGYVVDNDDICAMWQLPFQRITEADSRNLGPRHNQAGVELYRDLPREQYVSLFCHRDLRRFLACTALSDSTNDEPCHICAELWISAG